MSSLITNLSSSTVQEIVNWVTTSDGCVHTDSSTVRQLSRVGDMFGIRKLATVSTSLSKFANSDSSCVVSVVSAHPSAVVVS